MGYNDDQKCCICGITIVGAGCNPYPVKERGLCCNECYCNTVIAEKVRLEID